MEIVTEEWRSVAGEFAGWPYEVSNRGSVLSLRRSIRLRESVSHDGYLRVRLCSGVVQKLVGIHRIVAMAFVDGYQPSLQVNHKNGIKRDNRPNNLEWVTCKENIAHAVQTGLRERMGVGHFRRKVSFPQAQIIRELIGRGVPQNFLARWFEVSPDAISCIHRRITYIN